MASTEEKNLIIDENLKNTDQLIAKALEKRVAHISEKAETVIGFGEDEAENTYGTFWKDSDSCVDCIPENRKYVSAVHKAICTYDKLNWVEMFYPEDKKSLFENDSENNFDTDTVVYLKNSLADVAYNTFSKHLKDPRVSYEETFSDVCEEVYYSRAPYCILPIENSEEGRLSGFCNMIRKYELKIVLTCNVESANGKITRFALLKRDLAYLEVKGASSEDSYLEIGLNFGDEQKLSVVLEGANYFGFFLNKVDSLPIYYSEKEYYYDVVFKGKGDVMKFLFWLELEVPRFEVIGLYTQIKTIRGKHGG